MRKPDRIVELGCIVCKREMGVHSPATLHHCREGVGLSQRQDDDHAIPLCPRHHLGTVGDHGEAIHAGKKSFEANHGTESDLLRETHAAYALRWPPDADKK